VEWRRRGGDHAWCLFLYRHTREVGYKVCCPNAHQMAACCLLCRDTGNVGFFRAERMRLRKEGKS
jgi:hypothetical protein